MMPEFVEIQGRRVRYYRQGDGPPLLLLHGGFGDAAFHWQETLPLFAEDWTCVAPDMPGYGESDPLLKMDLMVLVNWTHQLMETLELSSVVIIGNSFGGLIARLLAANHPEDVRAVVLVNGGVIPNIPGLARFLAQIPWLGRQLFRSIGRSTTSQSELGSLFQDQDLLTEDRINQIQAERAGLSRLMHMLATSPVPEKQTPPVPVLLLWGEEDSITPRVAGEHIQQRIPTSTLSLIADCRHLPHIEVAEVFYWQVTNYLRELDRPQIKR
jgi:pimeloyl-ACP methyl ester carboxylesterase